MSKRKAGEECDARRVVKKAASGAQDRVCVPSSSRVADLSAMLRAADHVSPEPLPGQWVPKLLTATISLPDDDHCDTNVSSISVLCTQRTVPGVVGASVRYERKDFYVCLAHLDKLTMKSVGESKRSSGKTCSLAKKLDARFGDDRCILQMVDPLPGVRHGKGRAAQAVWMASERVLFEEKDGYVGRQNGYFALRTRCKKQRDRSKRTRDALRAVLSQFATGSDV